ncbi:glycoside hydrolase family 47 protein [Lasiosphaeria ovina]|uniref:alpha-1,2-Mannosidase n=1 Tax=Lasiosphaeria ovina TaxID=92902 RepID=A0AAE0K6R0_9PEZI|nr:glycoside hydrolase family 47 protein [Lasiosphaeria ovina]
MAVDRRISRLALVAGIALLVVFLFRPRGPRVLFPSGQQTPPSTDHRVRFRPSTFDWTSVPQKHPVSKERKLPTGPQTRLHRVQHDFSGYVHDATTKSRQDAVRAAFVRSWRSYKERAWLRDELAPVTGEGKTTFGGLAATLVDSLDTLWIMGLDDDFHDAAAAAAQLDWANTTATSLNLFETTIRHLGGLLSAYDLSGEPALLAKAVELGNMLYMAFDTPNRLPGFWFDFDNAKKGLQQAGSNDPAAGPCSLTLEFTRLAQLTGESKFFDAVSRVAELLDKTQNASKLPGMWPKLINFRDEKVDEEPSFTLGALSDSMYEYLPKMAALLGGRDPKFEKMHRAAMAVAADELLFRPMLPADEPDRAAILFAGDAYVHVGGHADLAPDGQHLSCFAGGMFALGGKLFAVPEHVAIGEALARGCAWAYGAFPTGVMPELFRLVPCAGSWRDGPCAWDDARWDKDGDKKLRRGFAGAHDPRYLLRPEAIESVFLLYRMTGKADLRDVAWRMFEAVVRATRTPLGFSAIADVTASGETTKTDSMESFWFSETLKYFYLIFSPPDTISLDEYVLNTEAHPLRRPT